MTPVRALSLTKKTVATLLLGLGLALPAAAGPLDVDGGLRGSIYNDNYKLGLGAQLGLIQALGEKADVGLHLNYSRYRHKTVDFPDFNEFGGYVTLYYDPHIQDQPFEIRLGPHVGGAKLRGGWHVDIGGDAQVLFDVNEKMRAYGAFSPGYVLGANEGGLIRVGLGIQYRLFGGDAAPKAPAATESSAPSGDAGYESLLENTGAPPEAPAPESAP